MIFKFRAFTLAEVIIVLGIIGIIAQMAIPGMISDFQDKAAVVALKKQASTFDSALKLAQISEGDLANWYIGADTASANAAVASILSKYLKIHKICNGTDSSCFKNSRLINKSVDTSFNINATPYTRFQLSDGSSLAFNSDTSATGGIRYLNIIIDINGLKEPNRLGWDCFYFNIFSNSYIIASNQVDNLHPTSLTPLSFNKSGPLKFQCDRGKTSAPTPNSIASGGACTSWVYYNGNRDYLHCNDLNWQTKFECD